MRLIFAGTPAPAVPSLRRLAAAHDIVAVVTRPDAALGRKRVLTPSPVATAADELGLPVIKRSRLDAETGSLLADLGADLGVIVAYGAFVKEPLLSAPRLGWINLHFSLLPAWRGAAPVQHAVIAGERVTGASVFQLESGMDTGPVFGTIERRIGAHQTAGTLLEALAADGASLLATVVDHLADGSAQARPQQGMPSLAPKLSIDDARLDWTQSAEAVYARFRGVTPEPGAFTMLGDTRVKILDAAPRHRSTRNAPGVIDTVEGSVLIGTATDDIELVTVQPAGGRAMAAADWWRGIDSREQVTAS